MIEIFTERTRIIPYNADHIPAIMEMFAEPDSNKFIAPLLNKSEEFYLEKLTRNAEENKKEIQYWSVFTKDDNDFIGTMNLNKFNLTNVDQLGLHFKRKFWNKGYGKETCSTMLDYAKNELKMEEIHWVWEVGHDVSEKLALHLGFEPFEEMMDGDCELRIFKKLLS